MDDPTIPAASGPDSDGGGQGTEPDPRPDRGNVVYLVPAGSGPAGSGPAGSGPAGSEPAGSEPTDAGFTESARDDWAWVQEWRAGQEPTPWSTGVALSVFAAFIVGVAIWVLSAGLADRPVIAVLVNLLVAAGLTPAIWLSRGLPVLRWIAAGAAAGIVIGWFSALLMLPLPAS